MNAMESEKFFKEVNEAFAHLKADPDAWTEELAERKLWDNTLSDGQTDENDTDEMLQTELDEWQQLGEEVWSKPAQSLDQ